MFIFHMLKLGSVPVTPLTYLTSAVLWGNYSMTLLLTRYQKPRPRLASNTCSSCINPLSAGIIGTHHPARLTDSWGTACHTVLVLFWLPSYLLQSWYIFVCIIYVCMYCTCVYVCMYACITSVHTHGCARMCAYMYVLHLWSHFLPPAPDTLVLSNTSTRGLWFGVWGLPCAPPGRPPYSPIIFWSSGELPFPKRTQRSRIFGMSKRKLL